MNNIVCKFGGSSLADSKQILKVFDILKNDDRKIVVLSAPGKINDRDTKVTDLLFKLYNAFIKKQNYENIIKEIKNRFIEIINGLNIEFDIDTEFDKICENIKFNIDRDYITSRGEYLISKIISKALSANFIDAKDLIFFIDKETVDFDKSYKKIRDEIKKINNNKKIIIPGFYGAGQNGNIITFSRGGSDITGSIIAAAINSTIYENWTDVSGVLWTDPHLVKNPKTIEYITYAELRELSYMGATVLHEDAFYPVSKIGIPINVLNTNKKNDKGTMIVKNEFNEKNKFVVTGVAGKKNFSSVIVEKTLMNNQVGFLSKLLNIFYKYNISVEHCPTGIDTASIIVKSEFLKEYRSEIIADITKQLEPNNLFIEDNLSLIAVVGRNIKFSNELLKYIFDVLSDNNITVKMIDQGSSRISIIIGVDDSDFEKSIKVLYNKLVDLGIRS